MVKVNWSFRPLPLLGNPHLQTIVGNLLGASPRGMSTHEIHLLLPDGDWLVLHDNRSSFWQTGAPIAVLIHGLGGSALSGYMVRVARLLVGRGWRVVRMDQRGAGAGWNLARRTYHAGSSGDVRQVLSWLHHDSPGSPLHLVGFSLGGNIVLKLAGEATLLPVLGLRSVAALSAPIDLERCAELLARPSNRFYDRYFTRMLKAQVSRRLQHVPGLPAVPLENIRTLRQFDEVVVAPAGGFQDALDYYRRCSSFPWIPQIHLPTFLLTSRDDPFITAEPYEELPPIAQHLVVVAERGGHLGFLGWDGAGGIRWAERRLVEWLEAIRSAGG